MKDITSKKYNKLTVLKLHEIKRYKSKRNTQTKGYWLCICDCGNEKIVRGEHLTSGRTISCGCEAKDNASTHGMVNTPEYRAWMYMRMRLNSRDAHKIKYYGDTGQEERWDDFMEFYKDMGKKPTVKHELDRIDPFLPYCKENCRWATRHEQMLNTRRHYK